MLDLLDLIVDLSQNPLSPPHLNLPSGFDVSSFRDDLIAWGRNNGRVYPWRLTRDPYRLLIAEVLLHRTRADQVFPVYKTFITQFPSPKEIALAPLMVHGTLAPLGLRWRVDRLLEMNTQLLDRFGGIVPTDEEALLTLSGVGPYIAAAVECFSLNSAKVILDTNTVRILGRLFCLRITDGSRRSQKFRNLMEKILDEVRPREFNFALLDLGALICTSRNPLCDRCPVQAYCCYGLARSSSPGAGSPSETTTHRISQ